MPRPSLPPSSKFAVTNAAAFVRVHRRRRRRRHPRPRPPPALIRVHRALDRCRLPVYKSRGKESYQNDISSLNST